MAMTKRDFPAECLKIEAAMVAISDMTQQFHIRM
jgi:hypothetical protein